MKLAGITTIWNAGSHADVLFSRWLSPRKSDELWGWHGPQSEIASVFVAQSGVDDLSGKLCAEHGIRKAESISEALSKNGHSLDVDGIMLIAEHGDYPMNEYQQKLYPRKEFFDQVVDVFQRCGKCVPVFVDKGLSWNAHWARDMVETARKLGFPLMGGSSLSLCPLRPSAGLPEDIAWKEAVATFWAGREIYGYHSLDWVQSLLERSLCKGKGVCQIRCTEFNDLTDERLSGWVDPALLQAALAVSSTKDERDINECLREDTDAEHVAFALQYEGGPTITHLQLNGCHQSFTLAVRATNSAVHAVECAHGGKDDHYGHFAALARAIEDFIGQDRQALPIERTLLCSMAIADCVRAVKLNPGKWIATPHLRNVYQG